MTFLEPFLLAVILPFIALPIIIHLVNRMRYTPMDWAAMDFLFRAKRSSTKFAKLREIIILACRCLAILCLGLALARPLSGGWLGWAFTSSSDTVIIVLDRSSSMSLVDKGGENNKVSKVIDLVKSAAATMPKETKFVLVDSATATCRTLESLNVLDDPLLFGVTDTGTNMKALLETTYDYIKENNPGSCEVWITNDMQLANWHSSDSGWDNLKDNFTQLNSKVNFRILALSYQAEQNIGIKVTNLSRRQKGDNHFLDISIHLFKNTTGEKSVRVNLDINGVETVREIVMSQESLDYTQTVELTAEDHGGYGVISLPKDTNPGDNRYYFAYGKATERKTVVLSSGKYAKLLAFAAAPKPELNQKSFIAGTDKLSLTLADSALVIVDNISLNEKSQERLLDFAQKGGQVLLFPPPQPKETLLKYIQPGDKEHAGEGNSFVISTWNELEGPLANSRQGEPLPVNRLTVYNRQLPKKPGKVMASYRDGTPFLSRYGHGKGAIYYCSTSLQEEWSDLYKGAVLLPVIFRLVNEGVKQYSSVTTDSCHYGRQLKETTVIAGNENAAFKNLYAGIYKNDNDLYVLNRPDEEDLPSQISEDGLKALFSGLKVSMFNEQGAEAEQSEQNEMFSLFAGLILLFLIIEGFLTLRKPLQEVEQAV